MRVTQHNTYLLDLVRDAQRGTMAPAQFQRPYVWRRQDVLALLHSINKGFPIGSFLLWQPSSDTQYHRGQQLGPFAVPQAEHPTLLLDGQNRMVSLAWAVFNPEEKPTVGIPDSQAQVWQSDKRLTLDLVTGDYSFMAPEQAREGLKIGAYAVLGANPSVTNPLVRALWDTQWDAFKEEAKNDALRMLDRCMDRMREAKCVCTLLENANETEALEAFLHICRVGVPMSEQDFLNAVRVRNSRSR